MQQQEVKPGSDRRPRPRPSRLSQVFWDGTRQGLLLLQRCGECGRFRWTPQLACPACLSERFEWRPASGRGTLYSYTIVHRAVDPTAFHVPYVLAVVRLEEGPHMLTNVVDCPPAALRIGMPLEVRLERIDDELTVYPFAPAPTAPGTGSAGSGK
jgi:hypothetical protein